MKYDTLRIVIGPDESEPGISWGLQGWHIRGEYWENLDSGGWAGTGPKRVDDTDAWYAYAKRTIRLPKGVSRWSDADVSPYGWSEGEDHAPNGIRIEWTLKD